MSSTVETVDKEFALTSSDLIKFFNLIQETFTQKLDGIPCKRDFRILHWVLVQLLRYPNAQPHNIDDIDKYFIGLLKHVGYTVEDISFVLDRAPGTIRKELLSPASSSNP
jgi:hypothetical protein